MARRKTTTERAQRLDPAYFRRLHPFRRTRLALSVGLCAGAALWIAGSFAFSGEEIYLRGGFADAHLPLHDQCSICHVEAFGSVPDPVCVGCHAGSAHLPPGQTPPEPACASCHAEHGGRAHLGEVGDKYCNACHERHRNVMSFDDHVQFQRPSREQHLRFDHRAHLAADVLGGPLRCADCHRLRPEGRVFEPVRFEEHCARCHRERLDPDLGAEVPHGEQPARLREWALAIFLDASLAGEGPAVPLDRDAAAALEARADAALDAILTPGRGCLLCHEGDRERIVPPEIPARWLPRARFDHGPHRKERCQSCHKAEHNALAEVVDIPGVEVCRRCHGEQRTDARCATCHPYHR